ncbi:MAG: cobalamin biosynthesis protein CobD, partial [Veillonella nakazawae]
GYNQYFKKMTFREYMGDPIEKLNRNHITRTIYMMYFTTILMIIISTAITYGMNV